MTSPNLAGFREAQGRLRQQLGTDATFSVPTAATYDPAEPIDPETGRPFDPFADPTVGTGEPREEVVRATVSDPAGQSDESVVSPAGRISVNAIVLDVDVADRVRIEGATHVTVFGDRFKVEEGRSSGLDVADRFLVYAERG